MEAVSNIDYHVEVDHNFYSVPYQLVHQRVEARFTQVTVEVLFKCVAAHLRLTGRGRFATRAHAARASRPRGMDASRLIAWANQTGPATGRLVAGILERRHPEQGYRACLGLMRSVGSTARIASKPRVADSCALIGFAPSNTFSSISSRLPLEEPAPARPQLTHENLRGATYYEEAYADTPDDREAPHPPSEGDGRGV